MMKTGQGRGVGQRSFELEPGLPPVFFAAAKNDVVGEEGNPFLGGSMVFLAAANQLEFAASDLDEPGIPEAVADATVLQETVAKFSNVHMPG